MGQCYYPSKCVHTLSYYSKDTIWWQSIFFLYSLIFFSPKLQDISKKNVVNRAKQKYMHRMGPKFFAMIRQKLVKYSYLFVSLLYIKQQFFLTNICYFIFNLLPIKRAKKDDGEEVTQAEMFIETRQPLKGKIDEETEAVIVCFFFLLF